MVLGADVVSGIYTGVSVGKVAGGLEQIGSSSRSSRAVREIINDNSYATCPRRCRPF